MIVLAILLIAFIMGFSKGFLRTLLELVAFFVAAAIALYISPQISDAIIDNTGLNEMISEISQNLLDVDEMPWESMDALDEQLDILSSIEMPDLIKEQLLDNNNAKVYELLDVDNVGDYIGEFLAVMAINVLSYIFVFILAMLVLQMIINILDLASHIPVIHELNKLAGGGLGLLLGLAIIWTGFAVYISILSLQSLDTFTALLETSTFAKFLYTVNPLMRYMTRIA